MLKVSYLKKKESNVYWEFLLHNKKRTFQIKQKDEKIELVFSYFSAKSR